MPVKCSICKAQFDYPEYELDKAFGKMIGGEAGRTCDACTAVILGPNDNDELGQLLAKHGHL